MCSEETNYKRYWYYDGERSRRYYDCTTGAWVNIAITTDTEEEKTSREKMIEGVEDTYKKCLEIMRSKNEDYAQREDPFWNFKFSEVLLDITIEEATMVRVLDKIARIVNLLKRPASVGDESLEDAIEDAINYLAIVKEERKRK